MQSLLYYNQKKLEERGTGNGERGMEKTDFFKSVNKPQEALWLVIYPKNSLFFEVRERSGLEGLVNNPG